MNEKKAQDAEYPTVLLTAEQRQELTSFPEEMPSRVLKDHFTISAEDLAFIQRHRGSHNRLGIAIQLGTLRFLGRGLTDIPFVPRQVIDHVATQLEINPKAFRQYGERVSTFYEHLERIRIAYKYQDYVWPAPLHLARHLLPSAFHSDEALPLIKKRIDLYAAP